MCMSCGCGAPNDNHGDNNTITLDDLDRAARAANIERDQAADNIMNCCQQQRGDQGGQQQRSSGADTSTWVRDDGARGGQRPRMD